MDLDHKKVLSKINYKKALIFIITRKLRDKSYKGRIKKFTGYANIARIKVEDLQNLYIDFNIIKGKAALLAIQNDVIQPITEQNMDSYITLPFKKGYIRLRLVGEQTDLTFVIKKI